MTTSPIVKGLTRRDLIKATAGSAALGAIGGSASFAQAQKLKGSFWFNQPFQMDNFQKVVNRFRTRQSKADLDFVLVPQNEISTKLATAIAGGEVPSAARLGGPVLASIFIDRDQAVALDDLYPGISDLDWIPAVKEAVTRNGKMYSMPVNSGCQCMLYNRDLYEKSGLDPDNPPKTLYELADVAGKISNPSNQTWGHYVLTAPNNQTGGDWFTSILWAFGSDVVSPDGHNIIFNSPEGVEALEWYRYLIRDRKGMPVKQVTETVMINDYLTGKVGSIFAFPSVLARVLAAKFKTGGVVRPRGPKSGTIPIGFGSIMTFKNSRTWEAGWEFAKFIGLTPENAAFWNISFGQLPARFSYRDTGIWQDYQREKPLVAVYTEAQKDAALTWKGPGVGEISTRLGRAIEAVTFGRQTPKEALDDAARDAQRILNRERRRLGV